MIQLAWGALAAGCAVAGLFFLRFWRESGDRLFAGLSASFFGLALNWAALGVLNPSDETRHHVYLLRLAAFLVLIWAIVDKNRRSLGEPGPRCGEEDDAQTAAAVAPRTRK